MGRNRGHPSLPKEIILVAWLSFLIIGLVGYGLLILFSPLIWPSFTWMLASSGVLTWANIVTYHRSQRDKEESSLALLREVVTGLQREDSLRLDKREREELLLSLEHELRTPLTAVYGFSRALYESNSSEGNAEVIQYIYQGAERLRSVLDRVLLSHKVFFSEEILQKQSVRPLEYVSSFVEDMRATAQGFNQPLLIEIGDYPPCRAFCDPQCLSRVLSILATQVFEYNRSRLPVVFSFAIERGFAVFSFTWNAEELDFDLNLFRVRDLSLEELKLNELGNGVVLALKVAALHEGRLDFIPSSDGRSSLSLRIPCMNDYDEDDQCQSSSMH